MTLYSERLWPSATLLVALILIVPATLLVFLPINLAVGVVVAAVLYLGVTAAFLALSPKIRVTSEAFVAGRGTLPIASIADVSIFDGDAATAQRGVELDARAWLVIRGWVRPVVRVTIDDQIDTTPYWLVSSRRPTELADAIATARAGEQA